MGFDLLGELQKVGNAIGDVAGGAVGIIGDAAGTVAGVIGDAASTTIDTISSTASDINKKMEEEGYKSRMKKYNPLFEDVLFSDNYKYPKEIAIKSDCDRRDIDVCQGAIGWTEVVDGMEILCLYEDTVNKVNIEFYPTSQCDTVYYLDPRIERRYVNIESIFSQTQQAKLAELSDIAYKLGARRYSVELVDSVSSRTENDDNVHIDVLKSNIDAKNSSSMNKLIKSKSLASAEFFEVKKPEKPELSWFKKDENINVMINQICGGERSAKSFDIELFGSVYSTMNYNTAVKLNTALLKLNINANINITKKAEEEKEYKMLFHVEF